MRRRDGATIIMGQQQSLFDNVTFSLFRMRKTHSFSLYSVLVYMLLLLLLLFLLLLPRHTLLVVDVVASNKGAHVASFALDPNA